MAHLSDEAEQEIKRQKVLVKHLRNELHLTRQEKEEASKNYLELYRRLDDLVKEKTAQLQKTRDELAKQNMALEKALSDARRASKVKSRFLSNISHELKTPLNAILGFSKLILDAGDESGNKKYIESIHKSGENLLALINDLIDLSRLDSGQFELNTGTLRLYDLMSGIRDEYGRICAAKNVEFLCESPEKNLVIRIDALRLRQVLIQLIGRAVRKTRRGFVHCSLECVKHDQAATCDLHFLVQDTENLLNDDGIQQLRRLLENKNDLFAPALDDSGFSLTLAARILSKMGGELTVESSPDDGNTFRMILKNIPVVSIDEKVVMNTPVSSDTKTVLIADDNPLNIDLLKVLLKKRYNYTVITAHDGEQAVDQADKFHPDIIFMDINMPHKDGFRAAKEIRKQNACPIFFISALISGKEKEMAEQVEGAYCLSKPIDAQKLFEILDALPPDTGKNPDRTQIREFLDEMGLLARVDELRRTMLMEDVILFADSIMAKTGGKTTYIKQWAEKIKSYAAEFDVAQLQQNLEII